MSEFDPLDLVRQTLLIEAVENADLAISVYDDDGRYVAVNDCACRILGYSREELLGHDVGDFTDDGIDRRVLRSGARREGVRIVRRRDGTTVPVTFVVVSTTVGKLPYFVAVWWTLAADDARAANASSP